MTWAVVTGGSRGLGAAAASALAAEGYDVLITYRRDRAAAAAVASAVEGLGRESCLYQLELESLEQVDEFARQASAVQRPAVLVNNAGEPFPDMLADVRMEDAERLLRVNTLAPLALIKGLREALASHPHAGAVVNVSSVSAVRGSHGSSVYAASKAALHGLTRRLAVELSPRIRVNAIIPGIFDTDMNKEALADDRRASAAAAMIPLGRIGVAEECAAAVAFLASERAAYITGALLPIDGGVSARLALP